MKLLFITLSIILSIHAYGRVSVNLEEGGIGKKMKIDECNEKSKNGTLCTIDVDDIRPLQFGIAKIEVECKRARLESMSNKELEKYVKKEKNRVNCVVGKKGIFLVDGHHGSRALYEADVKKEYKVLYCEIVANYAHLDEDDFWDTLLVNKRLWLFDEKGTAPLAPEHLPSKLSKMSDDPFRTLAWLVQRAGGFNKTGVDFEDFQWANFYRHNIDLNTGKVIDPDTRCNHTFVYGNLTTWEWCQVRPNSPRCLPDQMKALQNILPSAVELAMSARASHLPGWGAGEVRAPNCGDNKELDYVAEAKKKIFTAN